MQRQLWKAIPGYEGFYSVSNHGDVRGEERTCYAGQGRQRKVKAEKITSFICPVTGYPKVHLSRGNGPKTFNVHELVLLAFVGPRIPGTTCAHGNGNRADNFVGNLRWATQSENEKDKLLHGTHNRGSRHYNSKLTEKDVLAIRKDKRSNTVVAKEYRISQTTISRIRLKQRWAHL